PGRPGAGGGLRVAPHLPKPVPQEELLETICRVLHRADGTVPAAPPPAPAQAPGTVPDPGAAPLHVLVAEDNEFNAQLLEQLLVRRGHPVRVAANGRGALGPAGGGGLHL